MVVPSSAGGHYALLSTFVIFEVAGAARAGYLETVSEGYSPHREAVTAMAHPEGTGNDAARCA